MTSFIDLSQKDDKNIAQKAGHIAAAGPDKN